MEKYAPFHVKKYCVIDNNDEVYRKFVNEYEDNYHFVYKMKCSCYNDKFEVYKDDNPTVIIRCTNCNKEITVYDLKYYPSAIKLEDKLEMEQVICCNQNIFNVYPIYEYGDEFEYDTEFDENDITWCIIFIREIKNNSIKKLIDDETA